MQLDKETALFSAYEDIDGFDPTRPEKNLLFAILFSAISDLKKDGDLNRKATEFFLSNEDDYVFSFRSICDYLNIDPTRILYITGLQDKRHST